MCYFYDFNIKPEFEIIDTLSKFNYHGACIFYDPRKYSNKEIDESFNGLQSRTDLKLYHGVYIKEANPQVMSKQVQHFYKKADLIMVSGGDSKLNRAICEMPQVDIINHPYKNNKNSGINHVLANLLVENNITVNINIMDILNNHGFYRAKILSQINQLIHLQKKFNFRMILSSGSRSFYDVRSPNDMINLSSLMNMDEEFAKKALSCNMQEVIDNIDVHKRSIVEGIQIID